MAADPVIPTDAEVADFLDNLDIQTDAGRLRAILRAYEGFLPSANLNCLRFDWRVMSPRCFIEQDGIAIWAHFYSLRNYLATFFRGICIEGEGEGIGYDVPGALRHDPAALRAVLPGQRTLQQTTAMIEARTGRTVASTGLDIRTFHTTAPVLSEYGQAIISFPAPEAALERPGQKMRLDCHGSAAFTAAAWVRIEFDGIGPVAQFPVHGAEGFSVSADITRINNASDRAARYVLAATLHAGAGQFTALVQPADQPAAARSRASVRIARTDDDITRTVSVYGFAITDASRVPPDALRLNSADIRTLGF